MCGRIGPITPELRFGARCVHDAVVMTPPGTQSATAVEHIPLAQPFTNIRENELVGEVLASGTLSQGPMLGRFEGMFADIVGAKHAVAVSSGTAGLHLASLSADLEPGDELVTSPFAFVAGARLARSTGVTVRYVDVDPQTFTLDADSLSAAIGPRTRAVMPVHSLGWPVDVAAVHDVAQARGVAVIEDAREALGAMVRGARVGSAAPIPSVFAFSASRQVTTGEGGMVCTDDDELAARWRTIVAQGRDDDRRALDTDVLGYSFRLSDIACAVGVAQLEKLPRMLALRREIAADYTRLLAGIGGLTLPHADTDHHRRSWFAYVVLLDEAIDRQRVIDHLAAARIDSRPYLPNIRLQPSFEPGALPVAESIAERSLALPLFPQMSPHQQERVAEALAAAIATA